MDQNKLILLSDIGYHIPKSCDTCTHSVFADANSHFGFCDVYSYEHEKHVPSTRQLSIFRFGRCGHYELSPEKLSRLNDWKQFVK